MILHRFDFKYRYVVTFDPQTGEYFRSNVFDKEGNDTGQEPFMGDFPHLLDIGIKGFCEHGLSGKCLEAGTYCYQKGAEYTAKDMSLDEYISIIKQCENKTFQVALGGRGDPDCHPDFESILKETRKHNIIPNITTSGFLFTKEKAQIIKHYCGAAAVSWYKTPYTYKAIDYLLEAGVKTNIHFILHNQSILEAIDLLERDAFPKGIRAVIFLLYKPVGYDRFDLVLKKDNPYLLRFFELMNADDRSFMMGFDSCLVPGVVNYCKDVAPQCIEPCESGRFSAYISSDCMMYPCSFIQAPHYECDLKQMNIQQVWNSSKFETFRMTQRLACPTCAKRDLCLGGCPELNIINLCKDMKEGNRL
jgi:radical SAM protein with 4Fe4S-binding SPASM domain